jgi:tetratricopeptide (TPR) repeat protein
MPLEIIPVEPLLETDLEPLFAGPERIFHLPADSARELWRRTAGNPARVATELASWERAGLVRWSGAELVIDRTALGRLSLGLAVTPDVRVERRDVAGLDTRAEELLAWVALGRGRARASWLADALERPAWRVEAELEELALAGAVSFHSAGELAAEFVTHAFDEWSPGKRIRAHAHMAQHLKPGAPGRLLHLILGARPDEVPDEACRRARRLAAGGMLAEAEAVLTVGLGLARRLASEPAVSCLLDEWCGVALSEFSPASLDRVLFEVARERRRSGASELFCAHLARLASLLEAGLATLRGTRRALDQIEAIAPFDELELERWRQALRAQAARHHEPAREASVVDDIQRVWGRHPSALVQASLHEWRGRLAYRLGRYERAAELFADAAKRGPRASLRLSAMLNGASALLECGAFERAEEAGRAARDLARDCRHLLFEVRAEWILRAAKYRRGGVEGLAPDLELVDAAARVGVPDQEALIALNEAAVAWRAGHPGAAALAGLAGSIWASQGKQFGAALGRALQLAASPIACSESSELETLFDEVCDCSDLAVRAQIQALLVMVGTQPGASGRATASAFAASLDGQENLDRRLEVLAPREILEALRSPD